MAMKTGRRPATSWLAVFLITVVAACASTPPDGTGRSRRPVLKGHFEGEYQTIDGFSKVEAKVTEGTISFRFREDRFEVRGRREGHPPQGCGTFAVGDTLFLDDTCGHGSGVDTTRVLRGEFDFQWDGTHLYIERYDTVDDRLYRMRIARVGS